MKIMKLLKQLFNLHNKEILLTDKSEIRVNLKNKVVISKIIFENF